MITLKFILHVETLPSIHNMMNQTGKPNCVELLVKEQLNEQFKKYYSEEMRFTNQIIRHKPLNYVRKCH